MWLRIGQYALVSEPVTINPGLAQRVDLMAVHRPLMMTRTMWFFGVLAVWSAIGAAAAALAESWPVAAITSATAALSTLMWWVNRRAISRIPATTSWLDQLSA